MIPERSAQPGSAWPRAAVERKLPLFPQNTYATPCICEKSPQVIEKKERQVVWRDKESTSF